MTKNLNNISTIELSYSPNFKMSDKPKVTSADDVYYLLMNNWNSKTIDLIEEFKILLFNRQSRVLGVMSVAKGGFSAVHVDPKVIFSAALKSGASGILLAHNHPSQNTAPSQQDIKLTNDLLKIAKLHQIDIVDHMIVTSDGYFSFVKGNLIRTQQVGPKANLLL